MGIVDAEVTAPSARTAVDGVAVPHKSPIRCRGADELVRVNLPVIGGVAPFPFCARNQACPVEVEVATVQHPIHLIEKPRLPLADATSKSDGG